MSDSANASGNAADVLGSKHEDTKASYNDLWSHFRCRSGVRSSKNCNRSQGTNPQIPADFPRAGAHCGAPGKPSARWPDELVRDRSVGE